MLHEVPFYVIPIVFEFTIAAFSIIILIFTLKRYIKKKNTMTGLLLLIFLFLMLAVLSMAVADVFYYIVFNEVVPQNQFTWLLERFMGYRISFVFVVAAMFSSYLLMVELFGKDEESNLLRGVYTIMGLITAVFVFAVYEWGNFGLDVYAYLLVFVYMGMVYIRFMIKSTKLARRVDEKVYKNAIRSLSLMSLFIIFVFMFFLLDRVMISATGEWYSAFYYLALSSALLAMISAYYGYIKPKRPKKA